MKKFALFAFFFLFCQGCASIRVQDFVSGPGRPSQASRFFDSLDSIVEESGLHQAATFSVPRFPYLRTDHFLISLENNLKDNSQERRWIRLMQQLDIQERAKEILNLPEPQITRLSRMLNEPLDRKTLFAKLNFYSQEMLQHDEARPAFYEAVKTAVHEHSEYSLLRRAIGLYPLFYAPVLLATDAMQNEFRPWHAGYPDKVAPEPGTVRAYAPEETDNKRASDVSLEFSRIKEDEFGIKQFTEEQMKELVLAYAPVIYQEISADYDRFGEIIWKNGDIGVSYDAPAVYYYVSQAYIKQKPATQVNYVVWYSARAGKNVPWFERGKMDGLTIRITLSDDGKPAMADIMNNCGCYHFFVPNKEKVSKIKPTPLGLDPFVPACLPKAFPEKWLNLHIISGRHQIYKIDTGKIPAIALPYKLLPYDYLEALPHEGALTESVFDKYGIMKGSNRIEPLIFFSMGIRSIGNMRQRGRHPIKLLGKAHFSNPGLFDKNFVFR